MTIVIGCVLAVLVAAIVGLWAWCLAAGTDSASQSTQRYLQDIAQGDYTAAANVVRDESSEGDFGDLLTDTDTNLVQGVTSITDYGVDGTPRNLSRWPTIYQVDVHYSVDGIRRNRTMMLRADNPIAAVRGEWRITDDRGIGERLGVVMPTDITALSINSGTYTLDDVAAPDNVDSSPCSIPSDDEYPEFTNTYGSDFKICWLRTWPGVYRIGPDAPGAFQVSAATGVGGAEGDGTDAKAEPLFFVYASGSGYDQVDSTGAIIAGATATRNSNDNKGSEKSDAAATPSADKLSSIADAYSSDDVAVSAMFLNNGSSGSSDPAESSDSADSVDSSVANTNASRTRFVSAGLYLPVYLAAQDYDSSIQANASTMMREMDNDSGNQAILGMGGFDKVNDWLSRHDYEDTSFDRHFGDVKASDEGHENYSSTYDAVRLLAAVDRAGGSNLMTVDIAKEGVKVPAGMTVHAHRGQGIQNTWNYFIIAETSHGKAAIAVATQNQGKEKAAEITSKVLAEIDAELKAGK